MIKKIAPVCEPSLTGGTPWSIKNFNNFFDEFSYNVSSFYSKNTTESSIFCTTKKQKEAEAASFCTQGGEVTCQPSGARPAR